VIAATVFARVRKIMNDPADGDERWSNDELIAELNLILRKMLHDRPFLYLGTDGVALTFTAVTTVSSEIIATINENHLECVAAGIASRLYSNEEEDEVNIALAKKHGATFAQGY